MVAAGTVSEIVARTMNTYQAVTIVRTLVGLDNGVTRGRYNGGLHWVGDADVLAYMILVLVTV